MNLEFQTKAPGFDMPPRMDLKLRVSGPVSDGEVIGRIEIPQLERSVPMMAGYD
jgi:hypothetical protein